MVTGRPNSFRREFSGQVVLLRKLTDSQLLAFFQNVLQDEAKAAATLVTVLQSPLLSSWTRTPLHARMVADISQQGDFAALTSHVAVVRRCIREFLRREEAQASAKVSRTELDTKELLLARLAFETKSAGERVFSRMRVRSVLATHMGCQETSLEVGSFVAEVLDNHMLQIAESDVLKFAHDLYHDYFAACELETCEKLQEESGVSLALSHFGEQHWQECIQMFADLTDRSRLLIERGAEKNPLLAWLLLRDANLEEPDLIKMVAFAAYSVLEGDLRVNERAALAGICLVVLADLGRADLVAQAIFRQREILEPSGLWKLPENARQEEEKKIQVAMVPLGYGLVSIFRFGLVEQRIGQEGRYCDASRASIRALKDEKIKAAWMLVVMLASWTGKNFDAVSLIPGAVLNAIIELGVDEVLDNEVESHNRVLAEWLERASEAGFKKAWPAYGRLLATYPDQTPGVDRDPAEALKWLRKAHDDGDAKGSLELSLLLIEEPNLAGAASEGELLLRKLAGDGVTKAQFELGLRLLKGEDLPRNEAEGFELLLVLAEKDYPGARGEMTSLYCEWYLSPEPGKLTLPAWASPFEERFRTQLAKAI